MGIVTEQMLNNKLLALHTAYLAKVISVLKDNNTAKIQPLGMTKAYGGVAQKQSPLSNVPIATQKIVVDEVEIVKDIQFHIVKDDESIVRDVQYQVEKATIQSAQIKPISAGDIVVCVCCERNISEAKKGNNAVPPTGHHSMSDSIIIGVL